VIWITVEKKDETFDLSPEKRRAISNRSAGNPCRAYADFPSHIGALIEHSDIKAGLSIFRCTILNNA